MSRRDWFSHAFGTAVTDIRQKLVEEPWFGRAVTPRSFTGTPSDGRQPTMAERGGWDDPHAPTHSQEHDRGIDR